MMPKHTRIAAALVALVTWFGLVVQLGASIGITHGDVPAALWAMARYFTVITNLIVAIVFTGVALGVRSLARPVVLGGVTLCIMLVGIVFALLLNGLLELSGGARLADTLLHKVVPLLVPLWWLGFAPHGGLAWRHPLLWAVFPLAYFVYAVARGMEDGKYAYPFINVATLGWPQVLINACAVAFGFLAVGLALVWLDGYLARPNRNSVRA